MSPLSKLFANPTLVEVLSLFLLRPEMEFYQADIVKKTEKALMQVQRALKTLQEVGLVSSSQQGRMIYYKVVRTHPAFQDLKNLFLKTITLGESIHRALEPLQNKIHYAFIFGSVAKGNESANSDIDLFIIADITLRELSKVIGPLSKRMQRELNPVIFRSREFQKRVLEKDHFLLEVMQSPKLWIIGNESDFKQLGKRRKAKNS